MVVNSKWYFMEFQKQKPGLHSRCHVSFLATGRTVVCLTMEGTLFGGSCDLGVGHGQMWVHWVSFGSDSSCIWHSVFSCQNLDLTWLCIQSRDNFYLNHRFRSATVLCQREPATLNSLCLAFAPEPTNLDLRAFTPTIHPLPTYACLRVHGNSYPCHGVLS